MKSLRHTLLSVALFLLSSVPAPFLVFWLPVRRMPLVLLLTLAAAAVNLLLQWVLLRGREADFISRVRDGGSKLILALLVLGLIFLAGMVDWTSRSASGSLENVSLYFALTLLVAAHGFLSLFLHRLSLALLREMARIRTNTGQPL